MWIIYAVLSSVFAGLTAILAKCGIKKTDSDAATAIRTIVVLIFSWIMVLIVGSQSEFTQISAKTFLFLILSGMATGASWLCYFKALQLGDVNKVAPIDKSSTALTVILAIIFLNEKWNLLTIAAILLIAAGALFMLDREKKSGESTAPTSKGWIGYALLSAVFASLTALLAKEGIVGVESNLGTAIRTFVVLIMAWLVVLVKGKQKELRKIPGIEILFIILSGLATGASWLFYYRALQKGPVSVVVPIDKLSIVFTVIFSYLVLGEKLKKKAVLGLIMIVLGTVLITL